MKKSSSEKGTTSCGNVLWFKKIALNQFSVPVTLSDPIVIKGKESETVKP